MRKTLHLITNHWWGYSKGKVQGFWIGENYWVGFYCSCGDLPDECDCRPLNELLEMN